MRRMVLTPWGTHGPGVIPLDVEDNEEKIC